MYSKRDVAKSVNKATSSKVASPSKEPSENKSAKSKRKANEIKEESVNREQIKEKAAKLKTMSESKMGLMPQKRTESEKDVDVQIKNEENPNEGIPEQQVQSEPTISGDDSEPPEMGRKEEDSTLMLIKESVKWEKPRSSARVTKKPDRRGNNIMMKKIAFQALKKSLTETPCK